VGSEAYWQLCRLPACVIPIATLRDHLGYLPCHNRRRPWRRGWPARRCCACAAAASSRCLPSCSPIRCPAPSEQDLAGSRTLVPTAKQLSLFHGSCSSCGLSTSRRQHAVRTSGQRFQDGRISGRRCRRVHYCSQRCVADDLKPHAGSGECHLLRNPATWCSTTCQL
jgi:hypothetical protein